MGKRVLAEFNDCYLIEDGATFILGNGKVERRWSFEGGSFVTVSLRDRVTGKEWVRQPLAPCNASEPRCDFSFEGLIGARRSGKVFFRPLRLEGVTFTREETSYWTNPHLRVTFHLLDPYPGTQVKRHYVIYPETPAIVAWGEILSENAPSGDYFAESRYNVLDSFAICDPGILEGRAVEFYARTDINNTLVREYRFSRAEGNSSPTAWNGNFLQVTDRRDRGGLFMLKEAPVSGDRRPEVAHDFTLTGDGIFALGWGIRPEEVLPSRWRRSYAVAIGLYTGDEDQGILALKEYQMSRYRLIPARDYLVMANPWADHHCYERLGEEFVLKELEACARIGATHYQLDDGWQQGGSAVHIINNRVISDEYWSINPDRFPNSFVPLAKRAAELGVKLGLWFVPDRNRHYRNYQRDVDILWEAYRKFGISTFKLDAVNIQTKEAEENFEAFLRELGTKSDGKISFNFDVTGALDRRPGYFHLLEYGNIFLENRYTDWDAPSKKYYPFRTLRNLWQLAPYVLPQKLQIEFLNLTLNRGRYAPDDELAPHNYSWEYCFAVTMFANPLLWGEPSAFPGEAIARLRPLVDLHKRHREAIFACNIFPIGDVPDGYSWTGFQAHPRPGTRSVTEAPPGDEPSGFVIVFRENHPDAEREIELGFLGSGDCEFELLVSSAGVPARIVSNSGRVRFKIDVPNAFALYRYRRR